MTVSPISEHVNDLGIAIRHLRHHLGGSTHLIPLSCHIIGGLMRRHQQKTELIRSLITNVDRLTRGLLACRSFSAHVDVSGSTVRSTWDAQAKRA
mmetsp:Transcript_50480/g.134229  ORF Transcript_50480/g.134229 Transcript_50480/m.134229 type:complete len:95 (+) Transcript_50480:830-1114(+)